MPARLPHSAQTGWPLWGLLFEGFSGGLAQDLVSVCRVGGRSQERDGPAVGHDARGLSMCHRGDSPLLSEKNNHSPPFYRCTRGSRRGPPKAAHSQGQSGVEAQQRARGCSALGAMAGPTRGVGQGWGPPCLPWGPPRCHNQSPGPVSASVDGQRPPHRVAVSISGTRPSAPSPRTAARQPAQGHGRGWQGLPDPFRFGVEFEVTADPPGPSDILPPPECRPALDGDAVDQGPSVRTAFVLPSAYETFPFGWSPCTSTLCLHTSMHTHTHMCEPRALRGGVCPGTRTRREEGVRARTPGFGGHHCEHFTIRC